jgi:eukaryotic-like serine/threonine-protein kinase
MEARTHVTLDSLAGALVAGKYRVHRLLGRGSLGSVYLCSTAEQRLVALKFPYPQLMASEAFRTQFWLEAGAAAQLHAPNVVPIIEFGDDLELGEYYLAMPYVAHPDLATVLRENGALTDDRSAEITAQILEALATARELGLVHLNLKPSNVFVQLASEGASRTLVADFGCARLTPQPVGTPEYGSPEHARGLALDTRSDIYAVGVMLYEMLAGRRPFEAATALEVASLHCGSPPPPPSGFRRINPALESVCLRALSKTPGARYQSAAEMLEALAGVRKAVARRKPARRVSPERPVSHDSLAPFERPVPEALEPIPKRRAGLLWVAVASLACAVWAGYDPLVHTLRQAAPALAALRSAAPQPSRQPNLPMPDPPPVTPTTIPVPAEPVTGEVEPVPSAEPAQLVAIQAPPDPQPSAATPPADRVAPNTRTSVRLGAAWPTQETGDNFRRAFDVAEIDRCYRNSLDLPGAVEVRMTGRLDLEVAVDGQVQWCKLRAPLLPAAVRRCIERVARASRVPNPRGNTLEASLLLEFDPHRR